MSCWRHALLLPPGFSVRGARRPAAAERSVSIAAAIDSTPSERPLLVFAPGAIFLRALSFARRRLMPRQRARAPRCHVACRRPLRRCRACRRRALNADVPSALSICHVAHTVAAMLIVHPDSARCCADDDALPRGAYVALAYAPTPPARRLRVHLRYARLVDVVGAECQRDAPAVITIWSD